MMRYCWLTMLLLMLPLFTIAQTDTTTVKGKMKAQAEKMAAALVKADYETFVSYTHPDVIKKSGGKQKMAEMIKTGIGELEIISVDIGTPSDTVRVKNEIQATIPVTNKIKVKGGYLAGNSTLVAISKDDGNTWYFIEAGANTVQQLRMSFPSVSTRLKIAAPQDPVFIADPEQK